MRLFEIQIRTIKRLCFLFTDSDLYPVSDADDAEYNGLGAIKAVKR